MFTAQSLVWLALGGLLQLFGFGKRMIPAAAWLVPVFLLHFARNVDPVVGALGIWLVLWIALAVANYDVIRVPGVAYLGVTALIAAVWMLPYLADRLLAPQAPGFASTLVFPLAWVTAELISSRTNPFGTWGAVAYTQYGNLPLMQLASVAGMAGIAFLIAWFGSVVNWVWDNNFNWGIVQIGALLYAGVLGAVLLWGGARLAFARSNFKTVRVAVIGWPEDMLPMSEMMRVYAPALSDAERESLRRSFGDVQDWFLENARREARAGAKIILWAENNVMVFKEDEAAFTERAKQLAREEQVYLLMGIANIRLGDRKPTELKVLPVNPSGEIAYTYLKSRLVPGLEASKSPAGDGQIRTEDTEYGRIAAAICYDLDFPDLIHQVGRAKADMFLAPASDWQAIDSLHFQMAVFRAIENGVAMVRPSRWGLSGAVDAYGRTLATMDHFTAEQRVMVAQVPTRGVRTVYACVGDLFAWLCVAGLIASIGTGIYHWVRAR
jgi:apolipoprotein N-acyltransferase